MGVLNDYYTVLITLAGMWLAWVIGKTAVMLKDRQRMKTMPGPPVHAIFGHLISTGKVAIKLPRRAHPHLLVTTLMREYNLGPVFFMDTRPISSLNLIIADPEVARQISESTLPKHPAVTDVIGPLAGKLNMLSAEGAFWKKWRGIFNPGLSIQQIVSQTSALVECVEGFVKLLDEHAAAEHVFRLEEETTKTTIDIIGKIICDHDFKTLTSANAFMSTMRKTLSWMPDSQSMNIFDRYNPLRPIMFKYYKWRMDQYVGTVLDERFAVRESKVAQATENKQRKKTGIDLALVEYAKMAGQNVENQNITMDAEFRRHAIDNLLILIFAGHDTTASTLCYCYHLLQKHPKELAKVRAELDSVFGVGVNAGEQLKKDPYLINRCEYLLTVIKEILRLWPPASAARIGRKGYFIEDPVSGTMIDTEGLLIWTVSIAIHRNKRVWGEDADDFKPERFLPENADKLPPNAWRPFEKGPRNCIGQELALIEMKVVLAMTLREFDIRAAYDELDELAQDGSLWAAEPNFRKGPQEVFGERMHQILLAAGKPSEGMPARVTRRKM